MTNLEKAARMALEALEYYQHRKIEWDYSDDAAITAIRDALAERCVCGEPNTPGTHRTDGPCLAEQPAQQQEPVAPVQHWCTYCQGHNIHNCQFNTQLPRVHTYTTNNTSPQRKPWVGLTEEQRGQIINANFGTGLWSMAKDIEAKLKEKNT